MGGAAEKQKEINWGDSCQGYKQATLTGFKRLGINAERIQRAW
jgi:hypothetical protein